MLGLPVRYLLSHPNAALDLAEDPLDTWTRLRESYLGERERSASPVVYEPECEWELRLHEMLGAAWPCQLASEFWDVWASVIAELEAYGICPGPESFRDWNDADAGFVRTLWCLIRHLNAATVVETGVAHGVTSRMMLQALERNGRGHLWSIDLPPLEKQWKREVGIAVGNRFPSTWTYLKGTSRLRLPPLLAKLGEIDLFVHDSLHTERNVRFEMDQAWRVLRNGGAMVIDDIDANRGFQSFAQATSGQVSLVCEAEPLRPDFRRSNHKGMFGIMLKAREGGGQRPG
jgi:hypothetical protein